MNELRAELIRTKRSAASYLPLAGVAIGVLSTGLGRAAQAPHDVYEILNWQAIYATGFAVPLMALLGGLVAQREHKARAGGTSWRDISRAKVSIARAGVLAGLSGIFHLLCYGTLGVIAAADGFGGQLHVIAWAGFVGWVTSLGPMLVGWALTSWVGLIPVILGSVVWQLAGTLAAERSWWVLFPPTWSVRAQLPVLHVHQNAVPLAPGDPLLGESPLAALSLCVGLAVLAVVSAALSDASDPESLRRAVTDRMHRSKAQAGQGDARGAGSSLGFQLSTRTASGSGNGENDAQLADCGRTGSAGGPSPRTRATGGGRLGAISLGLSKTAITPLSVTAVILIGIAGLGWGPDAAAGTVSFAVMPLGATLLGVLVWNAQLQAWRGLAIHGRGPAAALIARIIIQIAALSAIAVLIVGLAGVRTDAPHFRPAQLAAMGWLWLVTGTVMGLLALVLSVRVGLGLAIGIGVVWTVVGVTLGGDVLASTWMWLLALPVWGGPAYTPMRQLIATAICVPLAALLIALLRRALRRYLAVTGS